MLHVQSASLAAITVDPGVAAAMSLSRSRKVTLDLPRWIQLEQRQEEKGDGGVALGDVPIRDLDLLACALDRQANISVTLAPAGELIRLLWAARFVALTAVRVAGVVDHPRPLRARLDTLHRSLAYATRVLAELPPGVTRYATAVACGLVGAAALSVQGGER